MSRFAFCLLFLCACDTGSARPEPKQTTPAPTAAPAPSSEKFGAAIDPKSDQVALSDVAKNPSAFSNKTFTTTGTVSAVCQHRGCWMEIKDDASEAHIKMAGHAFLVPKTASGRKARVLATLVPNGEDGACGEEGEGKVSAAAAGDQAGPHDGKKTGCRAEAEAQLGRPLAKLELVAQGVELL
jgi:hypothetical protein